MRFLLPGLAGLLLGAFAFSVLSEVHIRNAPIFRASLTAVFHHVALSRRGGR